MKSKNKSSIIEKQLGITGDYQYRALKSRNFLQANWHNNKLVVIGQLLDLYKPKKALDLGTGSGNLELTFAKKLEKIVGIDYNDEAIAFLKSELKKREIKNVELINWNILDLDKITDLGKFDMIFIIDVLEHLEADSLDNLIINFKKRLNFKGKIIIVTPNYGGLWPFIERMIIDKFTSLPHLENMQHVTKFNTQRLFRIFKKHGYKLDKLTTFNTFSFIFPTKFLSALLQKVELKLALPFGNLILAVFES
jgi:2-polyprenyl-3-methyl-5-hydroxy-6-metoxy-1,4-benzoquinol methylase